MVRRCSKMFSAATLLFNPWKHGGGNRRLQRRHRQFRGVSFFCGVSYLGKGEFNRIKRLCLKRSLFYIGNCYYSRIEIHHSAVFVAFHYYLFCINGPYNDGNQSHRRDPRQRILRIRPLQPGKPPILHSATTWLS